MDASWFILAVLILIYLALGRIADIIKDLKSEK